MTVATLPRPRLNLAPAPVLPPDATGDRHSRRRLDSLDAVRGLAVFAMLIVNNLGIPEATPALLRHSPWHGLTVADLVCPLFLLSMGVAMPLSSRAARPRAVARRVVLLAVLGLALSALKTRDVAPVMGVLQHLAGSYLVAWLILRLPRHWQTCAVAALLGGAWLAFELVGSWAPGDNAAALLDTAVLGDASPEGVMVTLVSSANVVAGAWVGTALVAAPSAERVRRILLSWALGGLAVGLALAALMPVNKRIWTPAYAVLTHAICCAVLLVVHLVVDRRRKGAASGPFVVLGRNAIAVYVAVTAAALTVMREWRSALVGALDAVLTPALASIGFALLMAGAGLVLSVVLWRRRVFIRV